jgi:hypothetical protein
VDYVWYAERYRWPPEVVDRIPAWLDGVWNAMVQVVDQVREDAEEKARRDAERETRNAR